MDHLDLGGLAQLITAVVLLATFIKTWLNGRKTDALAAAQLQAQAEFRHGQAEIRGNVATIEKATNSMKDALVAAASKAARAEGKADGVAQERAAVFGTSPQEPR
jgi:predicted acyltransferase